MGCPLTAAHHRALQLLHAHGSLTVEEFASLLSPGVVADPLLTASLLAHLIDHGWVEYQPVRCTFGLTDQGREALLALVTDLLA